MAEPDADPPSEPSASPSQPAPPGPIEYRGRENYRSPRSYSWWQFPARAAGGFVLFFATIIAAGYIGSSFRSGIAGLVVIATAFAALVVLSFIFRRRGWLTGWLSGLLLVVLLIGWLLYTCRQGWNHP